MEQNGSIYLDYAATTPLDGDVLEAMLPYFRENFGNPSSIHRYGQRADAALEQAREAVATALNARTSEILFTSGGTEGDNLALRGAALAMRKKNGARRILISPVEHHAVLHTAQQLASDYDFFLDFLPVDRYGQVDPEDVAASVRADTAVVSVVYANNEIGTINPIAEIGKICRQRGVPFHTDAVQAAAHLKMDVEADQVNFLAVGAHKFYGPKGVGALYVRRGMKILPTQTGGGQENGFRAGTQNIPYIVGLAEALRKAQTGLDERREYFTQLRDRIIAGVTASIPRANLTGHPLQRLPNHASFVFEGVDGNALLMMLDLEGFACSSGSACRVGIPKPSEVLLAAGYSKNWALGSLRVTLGHDSTLEHVERFLEVLPRLVEKARS